MRKQRWAALLTALCLADAFRATADDGANDPGQRVMVVTPNAELKLEEQLVGLADIGHVYAVERTNGNWLWIGTRGGWIRRRDIVPADAAIAHFTEKIHRDPTSAIVWRERSRAHYALGNLDAALDDLSQAIRRTPAFADAYNDRGNAWFKKGDLDKALADYTAAIQHSPNLAVAYNNRSTVRSRQGNLDGALDDLNAAIKLDPKYAEAWNNRGGIWYDRADYGKAIADYSQAIELASDYAGAYSNRALAMSKQGEHRKALDDYRRALELAPQFVRARNDLAWLLATCPRDELRDGAEAVRQATLVIELAEEADWNYLETRAAAHAEAGQFDEAVRWAEKALERAPDDQKPALRERLELYQSGKPYREQGRESAR